MLLCELAGLGSIFFLLQLLDLSYFLFDQPKHCLLLPFLSYSLAGVLVNAVTQKSSECLQIQLALANTERLLVAFTRAFHLDLGSFYTGDRRVVSFMVIREIVLICFLILIASTLRIHLQLAISHPEVS